MHAHRIETTIDETGTIKLGTLPFMPGDTVEVIILKKENTNSAQYSSTSFAQVAKAFCGKIQQAPADLSTNKVYFQGFGE